jgi:hypothetical protein
MMDQLIKDNGKMTNNRVKGSLYILMAQNILETSKIIKKMEKEFFISKIY